MLTDLACKSALKHAQIQGKRRKHFDGKGLFLDCTPQGKAYWRYKYRIGNKEKLLSLSVYPKTQLSEAREKHSAARKAVAETIDPSKLLKQARLLAIRDTANTFEALGRQWHKHNLAKWSVNHADAILKMLEKDLFVSISLLPVKDISCKVLLAALQKIETRGASETTRRSLQYAGNILRYAAVHEFVPFNIAADLKGALKPRKRCNHPSMAIDTLPAFLTKLDQPDAPLSTNAKHALELLMLTLVRRSELLKAEWTDFDLDKAIWTIPATRMKMRKEHLVPLSKQALTILQARKTKNECLGPYLQSRFVFPGSRSPHKHICTRTPGFALFALGYQDIHTAHGFRALGMGIAKEKLGYRHEVPDRQLAHVPANEVDRAYDRSTFWTERVEMMQQMADYIDELRQAKHEPEPLTTAFLINRQGVTMP